ncbi:MAG: ROK family protein [Candidatus Omnitrophica bacterium]|nr:ROK family protein [Candidatus Omnitrophota bacterium]
MRERVGIGIDVGGTNVKFGLVQGRRVLFQSSFPTAGSLTPKALDQAMVNAVHLLIRRSKEPVAGVGVGIPGLVKVPQGIVLSCANLVNWKNVPLKGNLKRRLRLPVEVENDVNAMTLAEWKFGAGQGVSNLVCLTLGTGVGGGLIINGRLYRGWNGSAGEVGHMPLGEKGSPCSCGGIACLERTVGNREILAWVRRRLRAGEKSRILELAGGNPAKIIPPMIDEACRLGDRLARETWSRVGTQIGLVLTGVVNLLNPERIVIGGGISKAGRWLFEPMRRTVRERAMRGPGKVSIVPAQLGSSAGLIGAALVGFGEGCTSFRRTK